MEHRHTTHPAHTPHGTHPCASQHTWHNTPSLPHTTHHPLPHTTPHSFNAISEEYTELQTQLQAAEREFRVYENKDAELRVNMKAKKEEIAALQKKVTTIEGKRTVCCLGGVWVWVWCIRCTSGVNVGCMCAYAHLLAVYAHTSFLICTQICSYTHTFSSKHIYSHTRSSRTLRLSWNHYTRRFLA